MAESLKRLAHISSFAVLQDKLDRWVDDYSVNTCEQNVSRCCEIIELNARVQGQLFKLLNLASSEGGTYGGASVIKSRLLPWLGQSLPTPGLTNELLYKDKEIIDIKSMYERSLDDIELDLKNVRAEADDLRNELEVTKSELDSSKRATSSDKMFSEQEVRDLRSKLLIAEDEISSLRSRANLVDSYERQVKCLREDIAILTGRKEALLKIPIDDPLPLKPYSNSFDLQRSNSPYIFDDVSQRVRQQTLITRFNDMFTQDRLDVLEILRRYYDDYDNNQRIVFAVMQEAFAAAKIAFANYKMKVRSNLSITHVGPETLEEAAQDYINRNTDLYDLPALVSEVVRALNRKPRIFLPSDLSFTIIQPFIREACKLAWNMSALAQPLDIYTATECELFDDMKYRRSYDSDYSAPLVSHHMWPCLVQGLKVIMKGEAVTRRGAALQGTSSSRTPSRSHSPVRSLSPSRARSRSPSPRRSDGIGSRGSYR